MEQAEGQIERTLQFAGLPQIIAAMAVGDDVEAILAELETTNGDSFNGQLLYNGLEPALDGIPLTCSGCHMEETIAPLTEGTWTRITEERLQDEALADYSARQYLVESILHPNAYIVEGYNANVMPSAYGQRLDLQQLADLLAYLESQDQ
jgi:mono/diheme cytochrome c family protein